MHYIPFLPYRFNTHITFYFLSLAPCSTNILNTYCTNTIYIKTVMNLNIFLIIKHHTTFHRHLSILKYCVSYQNNIKKKKASKPKNAKCYHLLFTFMKKRIRHPTVSLSYRHPLLISKN